MKKTAITVIAIASMIATALVNAKDLEIAFPSDYKSYKNYVSLDRTLNADQIIRLFANDKAAAGVDANGALADGSILVAEIYKAKLNDKGEAIESSLGQRIADKLAAIAVMEKRSGCCADRAAEFRTGEWDFAVFSPDGKRLEKDLNTCRGCHNPLKDSDFLFSYDHLK